MSSEFFLKFINFLLTSADFCLFKEEKIKVQMVKILAIHGFTIELQMKQSTKKALQLQMRGL